MRKILTFAFVVSSLLIINGCKSKKIIDTGGTLEKKSQTQVVEDVLLSELKYKTITTKGSIELKSGKATTVFKIIKDSVLQASVRPMLGMEAFRLTITPDSVVLLDRMKKQYTAERFKDSKLMANFDFNFYNLQAILTNQLFVPGKTKVSKEDYNIYNVTSANDVYMLQAKDKGDLLYIFAVDASDRIASTLIYNEKNNITLQWSYTDFIKDGNVMYPTNMAAKIDIAKKRFDLNISYKKLDIDSKLDVDTKIPSGYTKVGFSELIGAYIKMK